MRRITFQCNKYSPGVLYIMVLFGVTLGLLTFYAFLVFSGIEQGPEDGPIYFREHPMHAVYLIFGLIPIAMSLPAWIAAKCWTSKEEEAQLELYEDHAVLYWKNKELHIKKGTLNIKFPKPQPYWYKTYILKIPRHRVVLVGSVKETKEKRRRQLSLDIAIEELSAYKKVKIGARKRNRTHG